MCFFYATVFSFNCPNIISSDVDHKSEASKFFDKWWHSYLFVNTTLKWNDHKIWLKFQFLICFYYSRVTCVLNNFDQSHTAAFISQASDIVLLVFINAGSIKSTHCILLYKSRHCPHSCLIAGVCLCFLPMNIRSTVAPIGWNLVTLGHSYLVWWLPSASKAIHSPH